MTADRGPGAHTTAHLGAAPMAAGRSGPLHDVRVVDLTRALAGSYCTMILADMGADVIKLESPEGDGLRRIGPHTEADDDHFFGGYFASVNRNKRSIVVDLRDPDGVQLLLRLVDSADMLVENFRAGVMDDMGLGYETLSRCRPALVYGAVRGFGDPRTGEGPYTRRPAFDIVAQAMGGLVSYTGTVAGERVASGASVGDLYPATMLAAGLVAALHHARSTGEGQFVEASMMDSLVALCESMVWRYSYTGEIQPPRGGEHPSLCPFELYDTADGPIAIAAPMPHQWAHLCEAIGREDMIDDERYSSARRRVLNRDDVRAAVTAWTGVRSRAEVAERLDGLVPCGPVHDARDLVDDPHVRARGMLVAVDHPGSARPVVTPNTPLRFTGTPGGVYRAAPRLDEHRDQVIAELVALEADRPKRRGARHP